MKYANLKQDMEAKIGITGVYKIPSGTVERVESILNSNDLDWNNLN